MKSKISILATACLLASCGGGSGSGDNGLGGTVDEGGPEIPFTPGAPLVDGSAEVPDNDPGVELAELSELLGGVAIAYKFTGTAPVFSLALNYTTDDFFTTDGDLTFLHSTALTWYQESSSTEPVRTRDVTLTCGHFDATDQFLCILDANGAAESDFLFERLSGGSAQGLYEFCNMEDQSVCASNLISSPDGTALIQVSDVFAKASSTPVDFEILPYYQYLKQGTADSNKASQKQGDDFAEIAQALRKAVAKK